MIRRLLVALALLAAALGGTTATADAKGVLTAKTFAVGPCRVKMGFLPDMSGVWAQQVSDTLTCYDWAVMAVSTITGGNGPVVHGKPGGHYPIAFTYKQSKVASGRLCGGYLYIVDGPTKYLTDWLYLTTGQVI